MIAGGELNKRQLAELKKALASMELPPKKRQRLLWRMAKYGVIAAAKRNVRNQETPDGEGWEGRKMQRTLWFNTAPRTTSRENQNSKTCYAFCRFFHGVVHDGRKDKLCDITVISSTCNF